MATAERLVGHLTYKDEENNTVSLDSSYYAPLLEDLFDQYKLAIPELTIDDMNRVKIREAELDKITEKISMQDRKAKSAQKRLFLLLLAQLEKNPNKVPDDFTQADIDELRHEIDTISA